MFAPLFDVVSAPVRAVETMFEGVRTVASLREEAMHLRAENDRLKRWQRRASLWSSESSPPPHHRHLLPPRRPRLPRRRCQWWRTS